MSLPNQPIAWPCLRPSEEIMLRQIHDTPTILDEAFICLIETLPDAILVKDGEGRCRVANEAAKTMFKLHDVDWQGKTDQELGAERPDMRAVHETCLADDEATWNVGKLLVFDECVIDTAGNVRQYEVRRSPIFTIDGERKVLIIIRREITDIKLAERNQRVADAAIESQEA